MKVDIILHKETRTNYVVHQLKLQQHKVNYETFQSDEILVTKIINYFF